MTKGLPYILFGKYINILALEMTSPGNRYCANCISTLASLQRHSGWTRLGTRKVYDTTQDGFSTLTLCQPPRHLSALTSNF